MTAPRVLLIDDNAADRDLMCLAVVEFGFDLLLRAVGSFKEAVRLLDAGPRPDLVVTDLHLDDGDACKDAVADLCRRQVPVAVITSAADDVRRAHCLAAGARAFWVKPVRFSEMRGLLEQMRALASDCQRR